MNTNKRFPRLTSVLLLATVACLQISFAGPTTEPVAKLPADRLQAIFGIKGGDGKVAEKLAELVAIVHRGGTDAEVDPAIRSLSDELFRGFATNRLQAELFQDYHVYMGATAKGRVQPKFGQENDRTELARLIAKRAQAIAPANPVEAERFAKSALLIIFANGDAGIYMDRDIVLTEKELFDAAKLSVEQKKEIEELVGRSKEITLKYFETEEGLRLIWRCALKETPPTKDEIDRVFASAQAAKEVARDPYFSFRIAHRLWYFRNLVKNRTQKESQTEIEKRIVAFKTEGKLPVLDRLLDEAMTEDGPSPGAKK